MSDFATHFVSAHRFLSLGEFSNEFKTAFYYGVQGADLFFYYKPLKNQSGIEFGASIHSKSPKAMFEKDILKLSSKNDSYRGYYFGVMLHFFGDEIMHQYIGYLCKFDKDNHAHEMYERDIDVYAYQDEFNDSIRNFKPKKFYKFSNSLSKQIFDFWKERDGRDFITPKTIKSAMKAIVFSARVFSKSNKFIIWCLNKIPKARGIASVHFKNTYNIDVMNASRNQWETPEGVVDYSVYEIIDIAILNFNWEYKRINKAIVNEDVKYKFINTHSFNYGCE